MIGIPRLSTVSLAVMAVALSSGCALLDVELTSTPDTVRRNAPVTFDLKVTNRSQCPVLLELGLVAFMTASEFEQQLSIDLPPNPPQEVLDFLEELRMFFDELCSGGDPEFPDLPMIPASCSRSGDVIDCEMSTSVSTQEGAGSMTFATLGDRLRCEVDDGMMTCHLRIPLRNVSAIAGATAETTAKQLTCFSSAELGGGQDFDTVCFIGTFPNIEALGPGEMATGQVTLPARGEGIVRNFLVGITNDPEDLGVCKGGSDAGEPCSLSENNQPGSDQCPGSTCGEGICDDGDDAGEGCDEATQAVDCPNGGTCNLCAEPLENSFLPLDCTTTTVVGLEPAPVMSWRGMLATAAILFVIGSFWLQRRSRRRGLASPSSSIELG